ncbi:N-formylglutamate amidohydrolase [Rhodobacterales bacterium 52_120_T64]|nr:N-formylglutamate amidohydrolase [Rhodobacterales bacterium 52_120_T64]
MQILSASEGVAFETVNPDGTSAVLLVCEHASKFIPASLNNLGLDAQTANSHVAWDLGALSVSKHLSSSLDASLIAAKVSRLVYDCNRPPDAAGAMPAKSEVFPIAGNQNIPTDEKIARVNEIYVPFTNALSEEIAARANAGRTTVIVTIHSFTPTYFGEKRKVELGILHDQDATLADAILAIPSTMDVKRNQPYGPDDGVTHTLKLHALPNRLLNVMIEIRNDLIATDRDQKKVADELSVIFSQALEALQVSTEITKATHA